MKWLLIIVLGTIVQACSFGAYVDRIEEGSSLQATYRKDRYLDVRSGMDYAREHQRSDPGKEAATAAVSPLPGWQRNWTK